MRSHVLLAGMLVGVAMQSSTARAVTPMLPTPEFCGAIRRVVDASRDAFEPVAGRVRHARLGVRDVTVTLPGTLDCFIYGPPLRWYSCGLYLGDRGERADHAFNDAVTELRQCLGSAWTTRRRVDGLGAEVRLSDGPGAPLIRVVLHEEEVVAYAVDVLIEAPRPLRANARGPTSRARSRRPK